MFIIDWWNSLSLVSQVFACVAIPATMILLIQTLLLFFGVGEDADGVDDIPDDVPEADIGDGTFGEELPSEAHDVIGLEGLRIFTVRGIVAFFVVFGWVGMVMDGAGISLAITILVAIVCGFAMMLALAFLFRAILKLRNDGNADNRNAVGTSGKVYLTIPPSRSGAGKVNIMLQGAYVERDAVTDDETAITTGCEVVVIGISGETELVVRRK